MVTKYTPPCCRASYVSYLKQNRRPKYIHEQALSNRLVVSDSEHCITNTSATTNYADVALRFLIYNMASATMSKLIANDVIVTLCIRRSLLLQRKDV